MAREWNISDLEYWDERIREKAEKFGLSCYPQEFEICNHLQMLGFMAYSGMPSHYPHWSYGKAYERLKTLYDYGISGLPYEMVINSNPALAYLMAGNSLALQILTIAHVYGHNDFFKNNFVFQWSRPEDVTAIFKARADRVRSYIEDPSIGLEKIEGTLDAAHSLSLQCRRNLAIKKLSLEEQRNRALDAANPPSDEFAGLHARKEYVAPDLKKNPLEPDEDVLLFIRDYNPHLAEWERDILTIIHESAQYFLPQIETKIMNEGWASYWHREILNALDLDQDLHLEFLVRHNQVVRPFPPGQGINPYHLGLKVWDYIKRRCDEPTAEEIERYGKPDMTGRNKMFLIRETDRDISFLRQYLTEELMREMDIFEFGPKGDDIVVTKVSDKDEWKAIKENFLKSIGMGSIPVIKIVDSDFGGNRTLLLKHFFDGRELESEYAEKTLRYARKLWGRKASLETNIGGKKHLLTIDEQEKKELKPIN